MTFETVKVTVGALWVVMVGTVGLLSGVTAASSWLLLFAAAVTPAVLLMRYWNYPDQTMSQAIQKVLR
jgi:hypothetical protein